MASYIARRLLLMIFTIWGVLTVTFALIQFVPGGPVERLTAQLQGQIAGSGGDSGAVGGGGGDASYRGAQGLDPAFIASLNKQFGLDKPILTRYAKLLKDYTCWYRTEEEPKGFSCFNFGESYFRKIKVTDLITEKLPVSISLGLWMTLISHLISIPLGIRKAMREGSAFDSWSSTIISIAYSVPGFMVGAIFLILFGGGSFWELIPLRGLFGENWDQLSTMGKILDYFHHLITPLLCLALSSFATLTFLTKNSFLDEIRKQYVLTARMKGLSENRVLYGHVFRNAMLIVIASFPSTFIAAFFTGSLLIEKVFSLDGLGLLSYSSIIERDYPVVLASIFIFSLIGLIANLISDLTYTWVDPRIDFESRQV